MKIKRVNTGTHDYNDLIADGNKELSFFMGDFNANLDMDRYYWESKMYRQSWDSIMEVVKKIKSIVYCDGVSIFGVKHKAYIDVCNACYDADLELCWESCVLWVRLFYVKDEFKTIKTKNCLEVTAHAIDRFKERIEPLSDRDIRNILSSDDILQKYNKGGNGRYEINGYNNAYVIIHDFKVNTVIDIY